MQPAPDLFGSMSDMYGILPTQTSARHEHAHPREQALIAAVLESAVTEAIGIAPSNIAWGSEASREARRARITEAARTWIDADEPAELYSFVYCCGVLGLDVDAVRREVRARIRRAGGGEAPKVLSAAGAASKRWRERQRSLRATG